MTVNGTALYSMQHSQLAHNTPLADDLIALMSQIALLAICMVDSARLHPRYARPSASHMTLR